MLGLQNTYWSGKQIDGVTNCHLTMMMMILMMNLFYGMTETWKVLIFISGWVHCQELSSLKISNMLQEGFEPVQNLNSGFAAWNWAVVIVTRPHF